MKAVHVSPQSAIPLVRLPSRAPLRPFACSPSQCSAIRLSFLPMEEPSGRISPQLPVVGRKLSAVASTELAAELLNRLSQQTSSGKPGKFDEHVFYLLASELLRATDEHANRCSRKNLFHHMWWLETRLPGGLQSVRGKRVIEVGCGGLNPLARLFALILFGAQSGVGIDADEVRDRALASRVLAQCAANAFLDPASVFGGRQASRREMVAQLEGFDLKKLQHGDPDGLDHNRIRFSRRPAESLDIADGHADLVMSFAFLEHVQDPDLVLAEFARVTPIGGYGIHIIDGTDHESHVNPQVHPLGFLTDASGARMVHGSNRVRPLDYRAIAERHGFRWIDQDVHIRVPVDEDLRKSFAEPFASMDQETLEVAAMLFVLERV